MTDIQRQQVKELIQSEAWTYVEGYFKEEVLEGRKPINFKTEGKTSSMIAIEVMAREMAAKMVDKTLKKLRNIKSEKAFEKESYK